MAGRRETDIAFQFTGDDSGFQRVIRSMGMGLERLIKNTFNLKNAIGSAGLNQALEIGRKAFEAFSKVMDSTQGTADYLHQTLGLVDGSMQGLMRTIATGDWGGLIKNIKNTAEATRDLRKATEELGHAEAGKTISKGELSLGLQTARVNAGEATDPVEKKKYLEQAIDFQQRLTEVEVEEVKNRLGVSEDYYHKLFGYSQKYFDYFKSQVPLIARNYDYYFGANSVVIEGLKTRQESLKYLASTQAGGATIKQNKEWADITNLLHVLEDFQTAQNDLSKKGQWDEYVKGLGTMIQTSADGEQALVRLTKQLNTADQAVKKSEITRIGITPMGHGNVMNSLMADLILGSKSANSMHRATNLSADIDHTAGSLKMATSAVEALSKGFEELFTNAGGGFKSMIKSMISSLEMYITKLVIAWGISEILGMIAPGSNIAVAAFTNLTKVRGFASGTNYAPGGMAMVGEHGPELVNLPRGSKVIPNNAIGGRTEIFGVLKGEDIYWSNQRHSLRLSNNT